MLSWPLPLDDLDTNVNIILTETWESIWTFVTCIGGYYCSVQVLMYEWQRKNKTTGSNFEIFEPLLPNIFNLHSFISHHSLDISSQYAY